MKQYLLYVLLVLIITSCGSNERNVTEGRVIYSIEYPKNRSNFFLYSILPKEMSLNFKNGKTQSVIEKANLCNVLLVDCNKNSVSAYFKYANEANHVALTPSDVETMLKEQKEYDIEFTDKTDTMAGFNVKQAFATAVKDPSDRIEIWYTEEIDVKNSNWYNPFKKIPGFLMAYAIDRYGLRMEFKAKRFEKVKVKDDVFQLKKAGPAIAYPMYNKVLGDLFQSFE